jgi:hypothetical protein
LEPNVPDELVRIVARALAKSPEARYQTGRELADDLLALTRPGSSPTLRQSELATAPGLTPPGALPTLNVSPTMAGDAPTNVPAAPTFRTPATAPPTTLVPPPPPPAAPTRLVSPPPPPLPRPTAPKPPGAARATARPPAPVPEPARSRSGLLVGVGVVGLLAVLAVGVAGYFVLRPKAPATDAVTEPVPTPPSVLTADAPPSTTLPPAAAVAVTEPVASAPPVTTAPPATTPRATVRPSTSTGTANTTNVPPPPVTAPPPTTAPARDAVTEMFEGEPPIDGREAGDRTAQGYRSDRGSSTDSSFGTNRRFNRREKFPRDVTPAERRAVFVLLNVIHYQALHRQRTGRYGTFQQVLPRQVTSPTSFDHAGYRFDMTVDSDAYKVVATPQNMGMRGLVADDAGFVRYADE